MRQKSQILLIFLALSSILTILCESSKVIVLTDDNFQSLVLDSKDTFFIKFYATWCSNSNKMKSDWEKLGTMVKSGVKIGELDIDSNPKFAEKYSDDGTPTLKLFKEGKEVQEYEESRELKNLVEWVKKEVKEIEFEDVKLEEVKEKPQKTKRKAKVQQEEEEEQVQQQEEDEGDLGYEKDGDVIILTDDNFDELVMNNQDAVFIKFFAPWCGHCKKLAPDWKKLATKLKGKVKIAEVDATVQTKLGSRFKIHGYPSLKFFAAGEEKQDSLIRDYEGDRNLHDLKLYALGKRKEDEKYDDKDVVILNKDNFDDIVMKDEENAWVIAFVAPWDGNSRQLLPDWARLATKMKREAKFGKIDGTEQIELAERFDVSDYPVVKFFGKGAKDDSEVLMYEGTKAFSQIKSWVELKLKEVAMPDVVVLTDDNFDEIVFGTEKMVFIKFYAPWCGHCQKLAPEWAQLSTVFKDDPNVIIAKMDASVQRKKAEIYEVKGYPTLKLFPMGKKDESTKPIDYEGPRLFNELESYINEQRESQKIIEVKQLVSEEQYKESCENKLVRACFIAFLPHIYDCNAEERNKQLEMIKEIAEGMRGKPISFLWAQGGDYFEFEEAMALGTGYPAMFAVSHNKQAFAQMKVAFNGDNIKIFVNNLIDGKEVIQKFVQEKPKLRKTEEWDGQDKKPVYDDYDYDDYDDVEIDGEDVQKHDEF